MSNYQEVICTWVRSDAYQQTRKVYFNIQCCKKDGRRAQSFRLDKDHSSHACKHRMKKADWVVITKKERKEALQVRPTLSNVFFGDTQHIAVAKYEVTMKETTKVTQRMRKPTMKQTKIVFVL